VLAGAVVLAALAAAAAAPVAVPHTSAPVGGAASGAYGGPPPGPPLDHFQCYAATEPAPPLPVPSTIRLTDEFGGPVRVNVGAVTALCNPVLKVHGSVTYPIVHPDLHLVCYAITQRPAPPAVNVTVDNQFNTAGRQHPLTVTRPRSVCLPSYKSTTAAPPTGSEPLSNLDHFKCYDARSTGSVPGKPASVMLQDQFAAGVRDDKVGAIYALCNPVTKRDANGTFPPRFPTLHLVCYRLTDVAPLSRNVTVANQFNAPGRYRHLTVKTPSGLCLPSYKTIVP
jgi:hypothetical protein